MFYCGVGQVIAVVAKGAPGIMPQSISAWSAATGARVGADLPLPLWGRRFGVRLSADVLATLRDVELRFGDDMKTAMDAPPAWTTPRLTMAFSAGFVTDLRLK
jgi:hypothetical protein